MQKSIHWIIFLELMQHIIITSCSSFGFHLWSDSEWMGAQKLAVNGSGETERASGSVRFLTILPILSRCDEKS